MGANIFLKKAIFRASKLFNIFNFIALSSSNNFKKISAMEAGSTSTGTFAMMNQDFVKLDRFNGTNFARWQDKMTFFLTTLKIFYVLDPTLQPIPEPSEKDTEQIITSRKKREEDELVCGGHILNSLSDRLYDLYTPIKSPREIWTALEFKYKTEKIGTDKFTIEFKMADTLSVLDQIHDLHVLLNKLSDLNVKIPESFQVGAIIAKFPPSWNDYRKKLLHMIEEISLESLGKHLRIKEENRIRDGFQINSNVYVIDHIKKNKHTHSSLKVNKGKGFKKSCFKGSNTGKKTKACFHCGKNGHYIRDCRFLKNNNDAGGFNGVNGPICK